MIDILVLELSLETSKSDFTSMELSLFITEIRKQAQQVPQVMEGFLGLIAKSRIESTCEGFDRFDVVDSSRPGKKLSQVESLGLGFQSFQVDLSQVVPKSRIHNTLLDSVRCRILGILHGGHSDIDTTIHNQSERDDQERGVIFNNLKNVMAH